MRGGGSWDCKRMDAPDTTHPSDQPARRRHYRWLAWLAWAVFWLWFARFAYIRYTTPPAIATRQGVSAPFNANPEDQRLDDAIRAIGSHPALKVAAASDFQLFESATEAPAGNSSGRSDSVYAAIADPSLRVALADLEKAAELHAAAARPGQARDFDNKEYWWANQAVDVLLLQSRVDRTAGGAFRASISKLCNAYYIARRSDASRIEKEPSYLGRAISIRPLMEISRLSLEEPLSRDDAHRLIDLISDADGLHIGATLLGDSMNGEIDSLLDRYYTDDGHGDGWLVLSAAAETPWTGPIVDRLSTGRAWNVFSPLFHGRREIRAHLKAAYDLLETLDSTDVAKNRERIRAASGLSRTILDGPFLFDTRLDPIVLHNVTELVRRRRATVILLALSAYRTDHGGYPASLSALRPTYLAEIPFDAETAAPFQYRVTDGDRIELAPSDSSRSADTPSYEQIMRVLVPRRQKCSPMPQPPAEATP